MTSENVYPAELIHSDRDDFNKSKVKKLAIKKFIPAKKFTLNANTLEKLYPLQVRESPTRKALMLNASDEKPSPKHEGASLLKEYPLLAKRIQGRERKRNILRLQKKVKLFTKRS